MTTPSEGLDGAVLLGRDHPRTGEAASASIGAVAAVAMTAGAVAKEPPSLDPNEDVGAVAQGSHSTLGVVADGHFGRGGAEAAVDHVLAVLSTSPTPITTSEELGRLFFEAGIAVQRERSRPGTAHPESRTALALALVSGKTVRWGAFGDSCVMLVRRDAAVTLNSPRNVYLGTQLTLHDIERGLDHGSVDLGARDAVVLATDGLPTAIKRGGVDMESTVWRCIRDAREAREAAEALVDFALELGVDDAVTAVVVHPGMRRVR